MRRTTALTTTVLLGLAPALTLAAGSSASAAAETCRGQAATVVGSGHQALGTEGDDVIVTNGASQVRAYGGNDLVCVTGTLSDRFASVDVDAGPGNDVVDGTTSPQQEVDADLGPGVDRFAGGAADDHVSAVAPGRDPATEPDVIDGGGGSDGIALETGVGAYVVDNASGRFTVGSQVLATWSGLEEFWLSGSEAGRDLQFIGSSSDELVVDSAFTPGVARVDLGGGDDSYLAGAAPAASSTLHGGAGRDLVYVTSDTGLLDLDLGAGTLAVGASGYSFAATGFEDAELFAEQVVLVGTSGDNVLGLTACSGKVRGRQGDDTVSREYDSMFESDFDCAESLTINGGADDDDLSGSRGDDKILGGTGRDRLRGGFGDDRLVGGRGHDDLAGQADVDTLIGSRGSDRADGGPGRPDTCRAERKRRCER